MEQNQQDKENKENKEYNEINENEENNENKDNQRNKVNKKSENKKNKENNQKVGRKKGSNKIQLTPSDDWPFLPKPKNLLKFLIDEGRHVKLHITRPKKKSKTEMELELEKERNDTLQTVLKVYRKFFEDTNSEPQEQVIYFFRAPNQPEKKSIQKTVEALKEKFKVELENNSEIQKLQNQLQFNTGEVKNPPQSQEKYSNLLKPIKQQHKGNLNTFQDEQDRNVSQIEYQIINQNPFFQLDFIDHDLAKVLEKFWYLFKTQFIFELVLIFYAKKNDLDVTKTLLSMKTENKNFPEILQNILIKKILNNDSRINDLINEELEQFQQKFYQLFKEDAKKEVENFCESIYSIVKGKDNENDDELEPNITKKVKLQADDKIVEPPVNELKLSQGQFLEQEIYENDLGNFKQDDDTLYSQQLRLYPFKFSYGESGNQQY